MLAVKHYTVFCKKNGAFTLTKITRNKKIPKLSNSQLFMRKNHFHFFCILTTKTFQAWKLLKLTINLKITTWD